MNTWIDFKELRTLLRFSEVFAHYNVQLNVKGERATGLPHILRHHIPWLLAYLLVSVPIIGFRQRALATLLHESAHKTLARNRTLNFIAGTFLSGYLIFQGWWAYYRSHVVGHHTHLGEQHSDPDFQYLLDAGAYDAQSHRQFIWRFLISPLLFVRTPGKLVDLFRNRFFSRQEPRWERFLKISYAVTLIAGFCEIGFGRELVLFWFVPYLTVFPMVNWYIELTEHFPLMASASDVEDIYTSRNRWTGSIARFFIGVHGEGMHLVHHLFPGVPFFKLRRVHEILMTDRQYREANEREVGFMFSVIAGVPSILRSLAKGSQTSPPFRR